MKRYLLGILFSIFSLLLMAQAPAADEARPHRTPEEIAEKQTERLVRELELTDSLQRDTLYRVHLRYVRMRMVSNTRAEELDRMQAFYGELKQILTPQQYNTFMNMQVAPGPRQQRERPNNGAILSTPVSIHPHRPIDHR